MDMRLRVPELGLLVRVLRERLQRRDTLRERLIDLGLDPRQGAEIEFGIGCARQGCTIPGDSIRP
jgi:hypothetical protein